VLLSRLRAATGLALAALAVVITSAAPAGARTAAASSTPGQQMAAALRTSPLYVDPSLSSAFPPSVRAQLVRQISKAPVPVFILAVPLGSGGEWGNGDQLATVVQDYLGRPGIYLTLDAELSGEIDAYTWPSDPYGAGAAPYQAADAAMAVNLARGTRDAALAQKFLSCVQLISSGQAVPAYQAALRQLDVPQVAPAPGAPASAGVSVGLLIALIALIVIGVALAGTGAVLWLQSRRQVQLPSGPLGPAIAAAWGAAGAQIARRLLARLRDIPQRAGSRSHGRAP
jgi:hypothetical protein